MNLTSISGYAFMTKMPEKSIIKEPSIAFDKLDGDKVKGSVRMTFLEKDWENAAFIVRIAIGEAGKPKTHKIVFKHKVVPRKHIYATETNLTHGIMFSPHKLSISFNDSEIPNAASSIDSRAMTCIFDFFFRLVSDETETTGVYKEEKCVVCAEKPPVMMANSCKHLLMCEKCLQDFIRASDSHENFEKAPFTCPMCRTPVHHFLDATAEKIMKY